ncbi:MAG: S-methyl-5'-thioadenosine phosphorylase [Elusimicrobiota bacterium]|nr:S-methyl-5'-thioadenosine phosphorylase [Elusimicrobiota bacterium]
MKEVKIGVIGGSGIYDIEGITDTRKQKIKTPFGAPSDTIIIGNLGGIPVAFLPRHGRGHFIAPSELNSRANIYAFKSLGVEQIISISACGSLKEELKPRDIVIPDQLFDRTRQRPYSFFGEGIVAHIAFANPYCPELSGILYQAAKDLRLSAHLGGTYVCIEGPQFSTKAESKVFRSSGFSIIGMTNIPEAKLAREAEICYATLGLVTDYDVWKEGEEVTVERVVGNLLANIENVKKLIKAAIPRLKRERKCECASALAYAIQTREWAINKKTARKLDLLVGKYLKK